MPIPTRATVAAVAGLVLLSGCSVPFLPGGSGSTPAASAADPSLAAACTALGNAVTKVTTALGSALQDASADPDKALAALQSAGKDLSTAAAEVDNPTLKARTDKLVAALGGLVTALDAARTDQTKLPGATAAFASVQQELAALSSVCSG